MSAGQPCAVLDLEQLSDENGEAAGMRFIVGLGLRLARRDAQRRPSPSARPFARSGSAAARSIGVNAKPVLDDLGVAQPGLRAPPAICVGDRFQQVAVELLLMAMMRKEVLDRFVGKPHQPA